MIEWDSELYLRYEQERTQPSLDLARRIPLKPPRRSSISGADLGTVRGRSGNDGQTHRLRGTRLFAGHDRTGPSKLNRY